MNVVTRIEHLADRNEWRDRVAFYVDGDPYTHDETHWLGARAAAGLAARGVGRGDRVLVALPDGAGLVAVFLGAARLGAIAEDLGWPVRSPDAAVLAVVVGESARSVRAQKTCAACGVRVGCFRPPSVPPGRACLRLTGRASLTEADFAAATRALAAVRDDGRVDVNPSLRQ